MYVKQYKKYRFFVTLIATQHCGALMCRVQNWVCTDLQLIFLSWIRIRIGNTEMDPDPAAMKMTKMNKQASPTLKSKILYGTYKETLSD
jgi:hypothetical protein